MSATTRAARWAAARKAAASAATSKAALWIAAALAVAVVPVVALFGLILFTGPGTQPCPTGAPTADDGSPTIIGPTSLSAAQLADWYRHTNRPDPQPSVGYSIDQHVLRRVPVRRFAVLLALLPVTAMLVGFIALDQRPSAIDLLGAALVIAGVVSQEREVLAPEELEAVPA